VKQEYKNLGFTKHALKRTKKRSLKQRDIYLTIKKPDKKIKKSRVVTKYSKLIKDRKYQVLTSFIPKENKHLVISAWIRGEDDPHSFFIQLLLVIYKLVVFPLKLIFIFIKFLLKK